MKIFLTSIFLLFSLAMFGQDWQLDGTKYPNATNEGDTVSLATKVPLWDADNLQNYFADLGDILALNPVPPTPTLQSVTDEGSETTNNINVITGGGSGQRIQYSSNNIYYFDSSGLLSNLSFDTNASIGGGATRAYVQLAGGTSSLLLDHSQNASNPSASILAGSGNRGRLGIAPAINNYEAVTLGQMLDSIGVYSMTEGANTGYVTKFRRDNPSFYGPLGTMAIDFSIGGGPSETLGATGAYSVAIGTLATASNTFSTVIGGSENISSGNTSTVVGGLSNSSTARESTVVGGRNNQALGERSAVVGGRNNQASGGYSVVIGGEDNQVDGENSAILAGEGNNITGDDSVILGGNGNTISASSAFISGNSNTIESSGSASFVFGVRNIASGLRSFVFGQDNTSPSRLETTMGAYATEYTPFGVGVIDDRDRLFTIGNGNGFGSDRSDAFTILKNGQTGVGIDNFEANTTGEMLQVNGNIEITPPGAALLLRSPDGTVYELKVDNSGTLTVIPR